MIKNSNVATPRLLVRNVGMRQTARWGDCFHFTLSHKPETNNQSIATTKQFNLSLFCFLNMLPYDWKHLPLFSVFGYFF